MNSKKDAVKIDKEISGLVPKLSEGEYKQLEANIIKEGCRDSLVLWQGILLDGHYRYLICRKHKIEFKTVNIKLGSRDEAKIWVIQNQLGRRNLAPFQRVELVAHLEKVYAKEAKKNQLSTLKRGDKNPVRVNSPKRESKNTREAMAKLAGVSGQTYDRAKEIMVKASEEEKEDLRKGKTTIHKVCSGIMVKDRKEAARKRVEDRRRDKSFDDSEKIDLKCSDCLKILPTIPSNSVDLVLTDPPYNVGLKYDLHNDSMPDEDYYLWCKKWLMECCRVLRDNHYAIIFTGDIKSFYVHKALMESGLTFHHFLKWNKLRGQKSLSGTNLFYRTELAFLASKGKPDTHLINRKKFYEDTLTTTPNRDDVVDHPAHRPVELYKSIIDGFTQKDDTVLDCFLGSGSNGMAAKELGRRFIGIEISPKYFEMAKCRIDGTPVGNVPEALIKVKDEK